MLLVLMQPESPASEQEVQNIPEPPISNPNVTSGASAAAPPQHNVWWAVLLIVLCGVAIALIAILLFLYLYQNHSATMEQTDVSAMVSQTEEYTAETEPATQEEAPAVVTEIVTEAVTEAAETEPAVKKMEVIADACTWEEAEKRCEAAGGHLATISGEDDYQQILTLLQDTNLRYVWLGGTMETTPSGDAIAVRASWIDGSSISYTFENNLWYVGEPSGGDYISGQYVAEPYIMLWKINDVWSLNDNSDAALDCYRQEYIGYICAYDN
jgi:hypothetical protein